MSINLHTISINHNKRLIELNKFFRTVPKQPGPLDQLLLPTIPTPDDKKHVIPILINPIHNPKYLFHMQSLFDIDEDIFFFLLVEGGFGGGWLDGGFRTGC
jgi:hypothetical protein